jgi:NADH:ubiquinone oxidoreductase subunit 4 (subunit M)
MLSLWFNYILLILGCIPIIASIFIALVKQRNIKVIRKIALNSSLITLLLASIVWVQFDSFFF